MLLKHYGLGERVARKIIPITNKHLKDLPVKCRACDYWESTEKKKPARGSQKECLAKEEWFSTTLLEWGECGKLLFQDKQVLAYAQFGAPEYFPQIQHYSARPVSKDAVFLSCLFVEPTLRGKGLGKILLGSVEKDLYRREFKALETFASKQPEPGTSGPLDFYLKQGFYVKKDDPITPLVRLDFKSMIPWHENLEKVLNSLKLQIPVKAPAPL